MADENFIAQMMLSYYTSLWGDSLLVLKYQIQRLNILVMINNY